MSNNRPVSSKDEQQTTTVAPTTPTAPSSSPSSKKSSEQPTDLRMLAREGGRILVVGTGVAAALYPLDIVMQKLHTKGSVPSAEPSTGPKPKWTSSWAAAARKGFTFSAARILARGYASSAQASVLKNATITQRGKVADAFSEAEEKLSEGMEEGGRRLTPFQMASAAGLIGFVDTSLTQKAANERALHFHEFLMKQKGVVFTAPSPATFAEHMRLYSIGYPLRLSRNIGMVGGLLTATYFEDQMKASKHFTGLSDKQRAFAAATTAGIFTGFLGNVIDIGYKNQIIAIRPNFTSPSARETFKKLMAEGGSKALTRGFGTSILYTVIAYNVVPYMEDVASKRVPQAEEAMTFAFASVAGLFSKKPPKGPSASAQQAPSQAPAVKQEQDKAPSPTRR